jgi:hypothetical protein
MEDVEFMSGGTSTSDYMASASADTKWLKFYCQSTATSGDARVAYLRLNLNGAGTGGGEAVRAYTVVSAALTTGSVHGIHATAEQTAAGTQAGQIAGGRFTFTAAAATRTLSGTSAGIIVESSIAAGNTVDGQKCAFVQFNDLGDVKMPYLFNFDGCTAGTDGAIEVDSGAVGATVYGYLRILTDTASVGYIPIYTSHS